METIETIDTTKTYIFTNSDSPDQVLGVPNYGIPVLQMMNASRAGSNAQWFLTRTDRNPQLYRIHAVARGVSQSLDVVNDSGGDTSTRLRMGKTGEFSGQEWRFDRWDGNAGLRLSNGFTGPDMHLDIDRRTRRAELFGGDFPAQHWTLTSAAETGQEAEGSTFLSGDGVVGLAFFGALGLAVLVVMLAFLAARFRVSRIRDAPAELSAEEKMARVETFGEKRPKALSVVYEEERSRSSSDAGLGTLDSLDSLQRPDTVSAVNNYRLVEPWSSLVAELPDQKY